MILYVLLKALFRSKDNVSRDSETPEPKNTNLQHQNGKRQDQTSKHSHLWELDRIH